MANKKLFLYVGVPALIITGAAGYHRVRRNTELDRQKVIKEEGALPVTLATVENRAFRGSITFTGTLLAVNRAELRAEVSGRVTRVGVHEGDRVTAGAVLSAQDEDDLILGVQAAEAQLAQAQAQAQQAKRDNDRAQMLLEKRSVTKQAAQQAETYLNASSAAARAAESNLGLAKSRLKKARITAPFAGEVAQRAVQPGEMLNPGQTAFVVVDNRTLEILADLPTEALGAVKTGMKATFRVTGYEQPFQATLAQISPSVLPDGRTLRVRLLVPNVDGKLKGGLFAEGAILAETEIRRPALPSQVVTALGREAEVFFFDNGIARRKKIAIGVDQAGWRPVEGLAVGTRVVAQGRDLVMDGARIQEASPQQKPAQ
jgi:RND family efflux transporter MFP subunit